MKISTLKVAEERWGSKIGELLISIAIREALSEGLEEIYLTYYVNGEDYFTDLVSSYGFEYVVETEDGEGVYLKRLTPGLGDEPEPLDVSKQFYPSFYDGEEVDKFLIPIRPAWHNRLFPSYSERQPGLHEFGEQFISEANAIKKAYLNRAKNYQIEPGDVLLFYRSTDHKQVTSLGVCESAEYGVTDADEIRTTVGKRTVYADSEIEKMVTAGTGVNILLFRWHFDLEDPVSYDKLLEKGVLTSPLQTMRRIPEDHYRLIKEEGGIDGRFTVN